MPIEILRRPERSLNTFLTRLKAIRISEIFGVAGDYAFSVDDAVVNFPESSGSAAAMN